MQEWKSHYFFIFLYLASFLSLPVLIPLEGWKQLQSHSLFSGIVAKFQGTEVEGIGCVCFGGIQLTGNAIFFHTTVYWNEMAIYPFDSWSPIRPCRLRDNKMSRCPEELSVLTAHFAISEAPFGYR